MIFTMDFAYLPPDEQGPSHPETFQQRPSDVVAHATHDILIDNRDRPADAVSPFDFHINMQDIGLPPLRGVTSLTLRYCCIPRCAGEDYVLLYLGQGGSDEVISSDQNCPYPSMVIFYDSQVLPTGSTKAVRESQTIHFDPPISLSRLNIKVCKHGGQVLSSSDTANASNCSFLMKVTTAQRKW